MEYAFANLDLRRIVSLIRPDNLPSRRVAEKNGLCHERDVVFHGDVHGMHVILKQDWEIIRFAGVISPSLRVHPSTAELKGLSAVKGAWAPTL